MTAVHRRPPKEANGKNFRQYMGSKIIWAVELFWWVVSILTGIVLVLPYYDVMIDTVPFMVPNIIISILMVQCLRHIFFLRYSLLGSRKWIMIPFVFVSIPICFYTIRHYSFMMLFFETSTWGHHFSYLLNANEKMDLSKYIITEFRIISVTTIVLAIILSFRLMVALWRLINRKGPI